MRILPHFQLYSTTPFAGPLAPSSSHCYAPSAVRRPCDRPVVSVAITRRLSLTPTTGGAPQGQIRGSPEGRGLSWPMMIVRDMDLVVTRLMTRVFSEKRLQRLHPHDSATRRQQGGTQEVTWGWEGNEMDGLGIGGHQSRFMGARTEGGGSRPEAPRHTVALYDVATRLYDKSLLRRRG